ncbi:MAG: hypothetical protein K6F90_08785 [Lachnospiraceae bacterium]|nr:hypothetical protein [Lachnospiraceae bacterium]
MNINEYYTIKECEDTVFLLPFGQGIADHKRGVTLNRSGADLYNGLKKDTLNDDELRENADFISSLKTLGIIDPLPIVSYNDDIIFQNAENSIFDRSKNEIASEGKYNIAGININILGDSSLIHKGFELFKISGGAHPDIIKNTDKNDSLNPGSNSIPDLNIEIKKYDGTDPRHDFPVNYGAKPLIVNYQLCVYPSKESNSYDLFFPCNRFVFYGNLAYDGDKAMLYYAGSRKETDIKTITNEIFHAIRLIFLYHASFKRMFAIHSASLLYKEKAWLFSGQSGTGKSTHTRLWNKNYDTPLINGDINLISVAGDSPVIHGTPWCGTSGIYDNRSYPLGGITLLKQSPENKVNTLSLPDKQLLVNQRIISPSWTEKMFDRSWEYTHRAVSDIFVAQLECRPDDDAAHVMKKAIDDHLLLLNN